MQYEDTGVDSGEIDRHELMEEYELISAKLQALETPDTRPQFAAAERALYDFFAAVISERIIENDYAAKCEDREERAA